MWHDEPCPSPLQLKNLFMIDERIAKRYPEKIIKPQSTQRKTIDRKEEGIKLTPYFSVSSVISVANKMKTNTYDAY